MWTRDSHSRGSQLIGRAESYTVAVAQVQSQIGATTKINMSSLLTFWHRWFDIASLGKAFHPRVLLSGAWLWVHGRTKTAICKLSSELVARLYAPRGVEMALEWTGHVTRGNMSEARRALYVRYEKKLHWSAAFKFPPDWSCISTPIYKFFHPPVVDLATAIHNWWMKKLIKRYLIWDQTFENVDVWTHISFPITVLWSANETD